MIRKAVILAAGYGTRFLPATKAMPKEMLPVVDKPVIQYVVEDAVLAGAKDIVVVTNAQKRAIEDHFDSSFELESQLAASGKRDLLDEVREIANLANFIYVRQKSTDGMRGTLVAIRNGYEAIGEEPFLMLFGDGFFGSTPSQCQQLVAAYEKYKAPIMGAVETHNPDDGLRFGFGAGEEVAPGILKLKEVVEKPGRGKAPSDYAIVSGYVFTPELMSYASQVKPMPNGEYGYTDLVAAMIADGKPVYAVKIKDGVYYDCGNKLDYIKATIELALQHKDMATGLKDYLQNLEI